MSAPEKRQKASAEEKDRRKGISNAALKEFTTFHNL